MEENEFKEKMQEKSKILGFDFFCGANFKVL